MWTSNCTGRLCQSVPYHLSPARSVGLCSVFVFVVLAATWRPEAHGAGDRERVWGTLYRQSVYLRRIVAGRRGHPRSTRKSLRNLASPARLVWTRLCDKQTPSIAWWSNISRRWTAKRWTAMVRTTVWWWARRRSKFVDSGPAGEIRICGASNLLKIACENAELCVRWNPWWLWMFNSYWKAAPRPARSELVIYSSGVPFPRGSCGSQSPQGDPSEAVLRLGRGSWIPIGLDEFEGGAVKV